MLAYEQLVKDLVSTTPDFPLTLELSPSLSIYSRIFGNLPMSTCGLLL